MKPVFVSMLISLAACNNQPAETSELPTPGIVPLNSEEQALKEAIKTYPDSILLSENLIQYYREQGNYATALQKADEVLHRDSNNARLWKIKAVLHFENTDTLKSVAAFEKSIQLLPNIADMISLGTLYAQTGNKRALSLANTIIAHDKSAMKKQALFIKGLYYAFTNNKLESISYFDKCISLNFTFMDAYREKAIALYDLSRYKEALAVLDKAVTLQNNFDEGYYYRGKCLEKLNRIEEAIESYQSALMYSPDYTEATEALQRLGVKN